MFPSAAVGCELQTRRAHKLTSGLSSTDGHCRPPTSTGRTQLALEAGQALNAPAMARIPAGAAMSLVVASAPYPQAAGAIRTSSKGCGTAATLGTWEDW